MNITKMQNKSNCACVCIQCACGVHDACLGDAWQGMVRHNWAKCVKHTPKDQNMLNKFNKG